MLAADLRLSGEAIARPCQIHLGSDRPDQESGCSNESNCFGFKAVSVSRAARDEQGGGKCGDPHPP